MDPSVTSTTTDQTTSQKKTPPTCLIVIGMAGAGKTSFVQRLSSVMHSQKMNPYAINLDPACHEVPYPCNIDIRDTVNYKEVMKQYALGPNGAIMTSLNLFATKFNQIIELVEKRSDECKYVLIDTPGQIEVFTWSASGQIITESLASTFPSVVVYVMDTSKRYDVKNIQTLIMSWGFSSIVFSKLNTCSFNLLSVNPITFMSNMLYACSILYKSKLPFIIAMNKNDIIHHSFVGEWITNFDAFQNALESETSYMSNLTRSLSLVLDEFYENIKFVGVSSTTGNGFSDFLEACKVAEKEYEQFYKAEYEKFKQKKLEKEQKQQTEQFKKFERDFVQDQVVGSSRLISEENAAGRRGGPQIYSTFQNEENEEAGARNRADADEDDEPVDDKLEFESFKKFLSSQKTEPLNKW